MCRVVNKIQPHLLPNEQMQIIGFKKTLSGWEYEVDLEECGDTKLNVKIEENILYIDIYNQYTNGEKFRYNYWRAHKLKPELEYIDYICQRIDAELMYLQDNGVISGYEKGMFIYE